MKKSRNNPENAANWFKERGIEFPRKNVIALSKKLKDGNRLSYPTDQDLTILFAMTKRWKQFFSSDLEYTNFVFQSLEALFYRQCCVISTASIFESFEDYSSVKIPRGLLLTTEMSIERHEDESFYSMSKGFGSPLRAVQV